MAKRFIDTNTFNDPFIISLKRDDKLLYIYFWTICDHAGIFEFNEPLGNFHLDCKDYQKRVENFKNCYPDKISQLDENHYIIMNFCRRQYPKGVNTKVRQISGAIEILNSWNIEVINNQMFTLRVKKGYIGVNNPYGNGNGSGIGNGNDKEDEKIEKNSGNHLFKNSPYFDFELFKKSIDEKYYQYDLEYYHESAKNYSESKGAMYKNWLAAIRNWINKDIKNGNPKSNNPKKTTNYSITKGIENDPKRLSFD